jgi:hypothetical protein
MKNFQKLCYFVLILLISRSYTIRIKLEKTNWTSAVSKSINSEIGVKVFFPDNKISLEKINELLADIPKGQLQIDSQDIFVVNTEAIFWFPIRSSTDKRTIKTAGGLLGGIFEIKKTEDKGAIKYSLRPDNNKENLINKDLGMRFTGSYSNGDGSTDTSILFGLERNTDSAPTANSGKAIEANEGGIYSDNGIKIEFEGSITNQLINIKDGSNKQTAEVGKFKTEKDTDPTDAVGSSKYTITWKIPADKPELSCSLIIKPSSGTLLASSLYLDIDYNGRLKTVNPSDPNKSIDVTYEAVTAPEAMKGNANTSLANVDVNKYFKNSCVDRLFNYEFKDTKNTFSIKTPPGRGQVACVGSPLHKQSFLCLYPNNDNLPKEAYEDYYISLTENVSTDRVRTIGIQYNLFNRQLKLSANEFVIDAFRLKFIDATPAISLTR